VIWNLEFGIFLIWWFVLPRLRKGGRRKEAGDSFAEIGLAIWDFEC